MPTDPRDQVRAVPGRLPLLGHSLSLLRGPVEFLASLRSHGEPVRLHLGPLPVYLVTTPEPAARLADSWHHGQVVALDEELQDPAPSVSGRTLFSTELGQHNDIERRFHAEVDEALDGRPATYDDVPRLEYTQRIVNEVLRRNPPLILMRRTRETVDIAGVPLPSGTEVAVSQRTLHQDPRWFPDPGRFGGDARRAMAAGPATRENRVSQDHRDDAAQPAADDGDSTARMIHHTPPPHRVRNNYGCSVFAFRKSANSEDFPWGCR